MILGSGFLQNLRGTPLANHDFGVYFMQKPLGRHPLRFVILGSVFLQNLGGTPLANCDFGIYFMQNTFRGTPLAICDFEFWFFTKP